MQASSLDQAAGETELGSAVGFLTARLGCKFPERTPRPTRITCDPSALLQGAQRFGNRTRSL
jgi:hypothetical protein